MDDDLTITVDAKRFGGWKDIEVTRRLEALAGSFAVQAIDREPGSTERLSIEAGSPCVVAIGGEKVMTGYVDDVDPSYDAERHAFVIKGRDKTGDLVDCSAIHKPGSWKARKVEQIAGDLAAPFGIAVSLQGSAASALPAFALQQGESVFEAIDRLCKQRALLPITDVEGNVTLIRPAAVKASYRLVEGVNVKSAGFRNHVSERYSDYVLKAHGQGADLLAGTSASRPQAAAKDPGVHRYRPLLIISQSGASAATLKDRAKWEATTRAGKAQELSITVTGWRSEDGQLYRIDHLVPVSLPTLGIDAELLVSAVTFRRGGRGTTTELTLTPKEAFSLLEVATAGRGRAK